jgi:hypothetical protein
MTALILYDNYTLASKANTLLQRASARADRTLDWEIISWRTVMLRSQPFAQSALDQAVRANLIICAWLDGRPLYYWAEKWLERWAACRNYRDAAIAVLGEGWDATNVPGASAALELTRFTARHGLPFIAGERTGLPMARMCVVNPVGHVMEDFAA